MNIAEIKKETTSLKNELSRNLKFILIFSIFLALIPYTFYAFLYAKSSIIAYHHILFFFCFSLVLSILFIISFEDEFEKPRRQGEIAFRLLMFLSLVYIFSVLLVLSTAVFFIKLRLFSSVFTYFIIALSILLNIFILVFIVAMSSDKLYVFLYNKTESFYVFFNKKINLEKKNI